MTSHFEEKRSMSSGLVWFFIQIMFILILIKDDNSQLSHSDHIP